VRRREWTGWASPSAPRPDVDAWRGSPDAYGQLASLRRKGESVRDSSAVAATGSASDWWLVDWSPRIARAKKAAGCRRGAVQVVVGIQGGSPAGAEAVKFSWLVRLTGECPWCAESGEMLVRWPSSWASRSAVRRSIRTRPRCCVGHSGRVAAPYPAGRTMGLRRRGQARLLGAIRGEVKNTTIKVVLVPVACSAHADDAK